MTLIALLLSLSLVNRCASHEDEPKGRHDYVFVLLVRAVHISTCSVACICCLIHLNYELLLFHFLSCLVFSPCLFFVYVRDPIIGLLHFKNILNDHCLF